MCASGGWGEDRGLLSQSSLGQAEPARQGSGAAGAKVRARPVVGGPGQSGPAGLSMSVQQVRVSSRPRAVLGQPCRKLGLPLELGRVRWKEGGADFQSKTEQSPWGNCE